MTKESLYGYLIHYNPFKDEWAAVPRGQEVKYFNGDSPNGVIKANCITSLLTQFNAI